MEFQRIIIQLLLLLYSSIILGQVKSVNVSNNQIDKIMTKIRKNLETKVGAQLR